MHATVGHVSPWGIHCGFARHLGYWLPYLPDPGASVMLAEVPPHWYKTIEDTGPWPVDRCWVRGKAESLDRILTTAKARDIGILHWQWDPSFFPYEAMLAYQEQARAAGIQTVVTTHTVERGDLWLRANKTALRVADQVVAGTPAMVQAWTDLAAEYHIPLARPVKLVYLPVPAQTPLARPERADHNGRRPTVVCWGMLSAIKGIEPVYRAVGKLRADGFGDAHLIVAGRAITPEQQKTAARLAELAGSDPEGLELREGFMPEDDIYRLCQSADVIVLNHQAAHQSSSGTVALSVASGTPVVVSDSPMFSGYAEAGAVAVAAGDSPEAIAQTIRQVLAAPGEHAEGRARMLRLIHPAYVAGQYEEIYEAMEPETAAVTVPVAADPIAAAITVLVYRAECLEQQAAELADQAKRLRYAAQCLEQPSP